MNIPPIPPRCEFLPIKNEYGGECFKLTYSSPYPIRHLLSGNPSRYIVAAVACYFWERQFEAWSEWFDWFANECNHDMTNEDFRMYYLIQGKELDHIKRQWRAWAEVGS